MVSLHHKDEAILRNIQKFLKVGEIYLESGRDIAKYVVRSPKELSTIVKHFDEFSLLTQKRADYLLFKQAFLILQKNEHLTLEGLHKLVAIKASMNLGLSDELKVAFPSTVPVKRPLVLDKEIRNPE